MQGGAFAAQPGPSPVRIDGGDDAHQIVEGRAMMHMLEMRDLVRNGGQPNMGRR